jgi:hypothetical protein
VTIDPSRPGAAAKHGGRPDRGVALLEVVVAVGVFAMTLLLLQGALWTGWGFLRVTRSEPNPMTDALVARRILQEWFTSAAMAFDPTDARPLLFEGEVHRMQFPIARTHSGGRSGLALAELTLMTDPDTGATRLGARRLSLGTGFAAQTPRSTLLYWIGPLAFAYSGAAPGEPAAWALRWDHHSDLPKRVAIMSASGPVLAFSLERAPLEACLGPASTGCGPSPRP